MNTDLPLINYEDDKLGRFTFASEIADGLVKSFQENNESIVLGINGNWGSGKSTLINFIINEVERISSENGCEIITLRFNPWMFSGQKELQNIFLKEMFLKLESNKEKLKGASQKIADFLSHLNWLKYVHSGAGDAVKDVQEFLEGINKEKDLAQLKKELDEILIKSKVKLYITIDDIDRLTPSEITDIFQLVKLNGNFANTIFILAYDQKVVTSALDNQFGENGKKYIEKIVQVDYTLPKISTQNISRIFIDSLSNLFPEGELQVKLIELSKEIKSKSLLNFFTSLRDIYRFNNSIKLRLSSIYNELNIIDFLLVESLRIFNYPAYEFVIENKENLIFKSEENNFGNTKKQSVSDFIFQSNFDNTTIEILNNLFSHNALGFFKTTNTHDLIREKRVSNENYFDRYFNLQLSSFDIQESLFEKYIHSTIIDEKLEILKKINSEKKLFGFLNWVEIKSKKSSPLEIANIISANLCFTDSLKFTKESFFGFDSEYMIVLRFCSKQLEKVSNIEKRRELILQHINKPKNNFKFSSFYIADTILHAKHKFDEGKLSYNHLWHILLVNGMESNDEKNDENFIKKIKEIHNLSSKVIFEKELKTPETLNEDELACILDFVKNDHSDFYDKNFHQLIAKDSDLIKFLWMSIKRSFMHSGDQTGYQLTHYQFFPGMDIEAIKLRVEKFKKTNFTDDENTVTQLFLKAYEDNFQEKRYYNIKTLDVMGY